MTALVYCGGPVECLKHCSFACPPNSGLLGELGCFGCGLPNCITGGLCGWPLGFPYMVDLFKNRVGNYVRRLTSKTKPKRVVICMIYHLDEKASVSAWSCYCWCCWDYKVVFVGVCQRPEVDCRWLLTR